MRIFAVFLAGCLDRLPRLMDELVEGCRSAGREWELALALHLRSRMLNERPRGLDRVSRDAEESLGLFRRLGDQWGMAEALAGQAEASRWLGDYALAADRYHQALELATTIGAHAELPMLKVQLGDTLVGAGRAEEGERFLREGIEQAEDAGPGDHGAVFYGRLVLAVQLGRRGEFDQARDLLEGRVCSEENQRFPTGAMFMGALGWIEARAGDPLKGLRLVRECVDAVGRHPLVALLAQQVLLMTIPSAVCVLSLVAEGGGAGELGSARRAARMLGAYDVLHHRMAPFEAEELGAAEQRLRAVLGGEEFEAEYAKGGSLTATEAAALVHAP
jgi:tetratricopeptide (TPR) repeat protein